MARPRKVEDGVEETLTKEQITDALGDYIAAGISLAFKDNIWFLKKGKLAVSGNCEIPLAAVLESADYLVAQERFVRAANRRDRNGNLAIGNIIDKSGNDISHAV